MNKLKQLNAQFAKWISGWARAAIPRYWADISGEELKSEKMIAIRAEEIAVVNDMRASEAIPSPKDQKVISTRWVDVDESGEEKEKY